MAEKVREVRADAAFAVVKVGVAHAACLHAYLHFAGAGIGNEDRLDGNRLLDALRDDAAHLLAHDMAPSVRHPWLRCVRTLPEITRGR